MFSYEERLKTFSDKGWPTEEYKSNPHLLAISGFVCKSTSNDLAAMCVYCKKHLEGWEPSDIPVIEHYDHKKDCVLFSPHLLKSQNILLNGNKNIIQGFVRYDLRMDTPFIFCYKCGSTDTNHACPNTKKFRINLKKPSDFFFIKLISGVYKDEVDLYITKKVFLPGDLKNILRDIFNEADLIRETDSMKTVECFIKEYVDRSIRKVKSFFDEDIKKTK
jgi:hypothetical protein